MIKKLINSKILSTFVSVAVSFFLVALFVYSASTISTNISTGGTLDVTATSTFNDGSGDYDFRIESDGQQHMFFMDAADNKIGIASSTPWGQFSVEAVQGVANASSPIFVIGDQGTTTPMFIVDGNDGRVGIASTSPYVALGVTGTTTSSLGMTIGAAGSGISNLLFGTCQINFPSLAPGVDAVDSCAATGTAVGDRVFITPILPDGLVFFSASATAANTIQVAVINSSTTILATAPSINPQAEQWSWMAIR